MNTKPFIRKKATDQIEGVLQTLSSGRATHFVRQVAAAELKEFYLSGYVEDPQEYVEWFKEIRCATPDDEIRIYINSPGGDLGTALQFMRVMSECQAHITCSVEGECCSAATIIFLQADAFEITPHSLFMLHNYSGGIAGKGGEMFDQAVFERDWSRKLLADVYRDFLTEAEVEKLLDNKDMWLHAEEVAERCQRVMEARAKEAQAKEDGDSIQES